MKLNSHVFLIFFLFAFLLCHQSEARFLDAQHVEEKVNHDEIIQHEGSFIGIIDDLSDLMGSQGEECNEEDKECLKRRMIAEAHLDYIYTQHHKP